MRCSTHTPSRAPPPPLLLLLPPSASSSPRAFAVAKNATPCLSFGVDTMRERSTDRAHSTATSTNDFEVVVVEASGPSDVVVARRSPSVTLAGAGRNMAGDASMRNTRDSRSDCGSVQRGKGGGTGNQRLETERLAPRAEDDVGGFEARRSGRRVPGLPGSGHAGHVARAHLGPELFLIVVVVVLDVAPRARHRRLLARVRLRSLPALGTLIFATVEEI